MWDNRNDFLVIGKYTNEIPYMVFALNEHYCIVRGKGKIIDGNIMMFQKEGTEEWIETPIATTISGIKEYRRYIVKDKIDELQKTIFRLEKLIEPEIYNTNY